MHRLTALIAVILSTLPFCAVAEAFQRPIPQAQSATAEGWFLVASVALVLALVAVHMLVRRR